MPLITLIRTAPDSPPGSMPAYAKLVEQARVDPPAFEIRVCDFFDPKGGGSMRRHHLWRLRNARRFFSENSSDLYHLLDGSMAGFLPSKVWKKTVVTVHDLIPLLQLQGRLSGHPRRAGRWLIRRSLKVLKKVAGITTVSDFTRRDLVNEIGRTDVGIIHLPVRTLEIDASVSRPPPRIAGVPPALPQRYIFHIGNNAEYKNRMGVLDVFERLQKVSDLHLLMAGPEPTAALRQTADRLERVHFVVNPSDAQLSNLYKKATAFLFPSLYEGFGMPVLEAMASGCPVVCSSVASLPEVVGNAALVASPEDIELLATYCRSLLSDPSQQSEMSQRGIEHAAEFSMERFSRELKAWYLQNINQAGDPS